MHSKVFLRLIKSYENKFTSTTRISYKSIDYQGAYTFMKNVKILQTIFRRLKRTPEVIVAMKLYQVRMIHIRARIHQIKRTRQGQI